MIEYKIIKSVIDYENHKDIMHSLLEFFKKSSIKDLKYNGISIIIEEILQNILMYGSAIEDKDMHIYIYVYIYNINNKKSIKIIIKDNSYEFNICKYIVKKKEEQQKKESISDINDIQNLDVGGWGIQFIMKISHTVRYQFINGNTIYISLTI